MSPSARRAFQSWDAAREKAPSLVATNHASDNGEDTKKILDR